MDIASAKALQAKVPRIAAEYEQVEVRLLVLLCRELQRGCGEEPFFLATRKAGRLHDVHRANISRWLSGLQTDKILKLETRGSIEKRKASRFLSGERGLSMEAIDTLGEYFGLDVVQRGKRRS